MTKRPRRCWPAPLLLLALCLPPTSAWSQDDSDPTDGDITVTARRPGPLFDSGRAGSVLTDDELELKANTAVPDALDEEAGVLIQKTSGAGGALFVRGLVGRQNLILIDGIRLNNALFRSGPNQYLNTIDPLSIERLELLRGAGSVLYGSDAMGGVLNLTTRGPGNTADGAAGHAWLRASSADLAIVSGAGAEYDGEDGGVFTSITWANLDNLRAGNGFDDLDRNEETVQFFTGYRWMNSHTKGRYQLTDNAALTLGVDIYRQEDAFRSDRTSPEDIRARPNQDRDLFWIGYEGDYGPGRLESVDLKLSYASQREHTRRRRAARDLVEESRIRDDQVGVVFSATSLADRRGRYRFTWGGDFYFDVVGAEAEQYGIADASDPLAVRASVLDGATYAQTGAFVLSQSQLTQWLRFDAGSRLTIVQADVPEDPIGFEAYDFQDIGVVFHAGVLSYVTPHWNFVLNASQGFRAPNLEDLTGLTLGAEGTDRPNPELSSEQSLTTEVGTRYRYGGLRLSLFGFATFLSDLIARRPSGEVDPNNVDPSGNPLPFNEKVNTDAARVIGLEATVEVGLTRRLSALFVGTWIDAEDIENETTLRREPPTRGKLALRYHRPEARAELYGNWALAQKDLSPGDRTDARICPGDFRDSVACPGTEGYLVLGVRTLFPNRFGSVGLTIDNILDTHYRVHGSGVDRPGLNVLGTFRGQF